MAGWLDRGDQGPQAHRPVRAHRPGHRGRPRDPDAALVSAAVGESEFDADTWLAGDGPAFTAQVTDRWSGMAGINGGYMLALCTRALGQVLPFPDPVVVSGFFLRPGSPGPAEVITEVVRAGKTTAFGQAGLCRDGKEVVRATAAFADLCTAASRAAQSASAFIGVTPF